MKKFLSAVVVVLGALTACTVQNQGLSYDEVYYNPNDKAVVAAQMDKAVLHRTTSKVVIKADSSSFTNNGDALNDNRDFIKAQQAYSQNNKSSVVDTNANYDSGSFTYDDYYDYGYASRIRRFHGGYFDDYYHDYYTNRYWYDMNPGYWGSSIYASYGFSPYFSFYGGSPWFGFGFGYSPFNSFYDPFYSPYYNWYSPFYYGYGFGYNNYYDRYYGGYAYGYGYYNDHDFNSMYYGPRRGGASNGPTPNERTAYGQKYGVSTNGGGLSNSVNVPRNGREISSNNGSSVISGGRDASFDAATMPAGQNMREKGGSSNLFSPSSVNNNSGKAVQTVNAPRNANNGSREYYNSGTQSQNTYSRPVSNTQRVAVDQSSTANPREQMSRNDVNRIVTDRTKDQPVDTRSFQQQQERYFKDRSTTAGSSTREANASTRYYKPTQETSRTQTYNSPAYSRPRSGNEYTSPSYRSPAATMQRSVSNPQRYAPQRQQSVAPVSSGSRREVSNYSSPAASYSRPSYSSPSSYSAPSYSAPSSSSSVRESSSSSGSSGGSHNGPRR